MKIAQTTTVDVDVSPETLARVAGLVSTCRAIQGDLTLLTEQLELEKVKLLELYKAEGITKLEIDGEPVTLVTGGTSSKMDKLKFVALGGDLTMLENAKTTKPKKDYMLIGKEKTYD